MTEAERMRGIELQLGAFRNIALLLGRATDLLHDAKSFAESVSVDGWLAICIAEKAETLQAAIMPEVSAAIEQLEAEARQSCATSMSNGAAASFPLYGMPIPPTRTASPSMSDPAPRAVAMPRCAIPRRAAAHGQSTALHAAGAW